MHPEDVEPLRSEPAGAYYLEDFNTVIAGVLRLHARLLTAAEQGYIATFAALSRPAQLLHVRLANRKGPYFRVQRLAYPEIGPLAAPLAELVAKGLLEICRTLPEKDLQHRLLGCFALPELRAALQPHPAPKAAGRAAMLDWLAGWEDLAPWTAHLLHDDPVVGLPQAAPWPFLRFLYFGGLRENLADFVVRALGHVVSESFDGEHLAPCFSSRRQADDAYRLACLYRRFAEIRDAHAATDLLAWWQGQRIARESLADGHAWFDRLVDRLGRRLEREGAAEAALALYATSPVAPARERQARLLIKAGRMAEAAMLLRAMQEGPCHPQEAYAARQLLARLAQKPRRSEGRQLQRASRILTLHYAPRPGFRGAAAAEAATVEAATVETAALETAPVETAVLAHYRAQGWQGVHSENWLWNASFGLLLWDIIYDPASGAFHSPLQFAPSDLYGPDFYDRRRAAIESRLELLRQPAQALAIIARHCRAKQGLANPFVAWRAEPPKAERAEPPKAERAEPPKAGRAEPPNAGRLEVLEILGVLLDRVPPDGHAAVLRHMARNLRYHSHGFLDLFIWKQRDYRFIEIKGEGDQLAGHQFEWLRFFAQAGINVSLERVQRPGRKSPG